MAPARRQNYARSRSRSYIAPSNEPPPPPPLPPNQDLMPSSSRYLHNLRVIQRHDPSITSLFDQFPHVCVYHHKGDEWQKKGCEGAMFLFEREQEPKYGFYILNRNNTGDYIQRMTPDDDVEFASAYLIYRAFGKVTSDTIGLWTMVTQDREAMSEVMMRLHSYIKRGERYPEAYRRGPDTWSITPAPVHAQAASAFPPLLSSQVNQPSASISTLSTLLAKLGSSVDSPSSSSPPNRAVSASVPPPTGIPLLDSIFASASEATVSLNTPPPHIPATETGALHALFNNDPTATQSPSPSASCGPTPTQHKSELPRSFSPFKAKPFPNGSYTPATDRGVFSHPNSSSRSGRETAPPTLKASFSSVISKNPKSNGKHFPQLGNRRYSSQYLAVPDPTQEEDEDEWEETATTSVSIVTNGKGHDTQSSSRRNRARNAKKREREKERRRSLRQEGFLPDGAQASGIGGETAVEWPLVDDRSLSMDEEDAAARETLGLGDGLLNALAAVGESELRDRDQHQVVSSKKRSKDHGKDRRKRKYKEDRSMASQTSETAGDLSSNSSSHPVEVRSALLEAYGRRRRIGDSVLSEEALASEVIELINNDPTFVRELHQQYLRKVEV
ncbi:hypothetical protein K439DRAFT_1629054 [Ramaria rubella]|nr:hypothetical protein K439DRAFT_1629054 [Ramaria rubella]